MRWEVARAGAGAAGGGWAQGCRGTFQFLMKMFVADEPCCCASCSSSLGSLLRASAFSVAPASSTVYSCSTTRWLLVR